MGSVLHLFLPVIVFCSCRIIFTGLGSRELYGVMFAVSHCYLYFSNCLYQLWDYFTGLESRELPCMVLYLLCLSASCILPTLPHLLTVPT